MKVLITIRLPREGFDQLKEQFEVVMPEDKAAFSREEVLDLLPGFDALLPGFQFKVDKEVIDIARKRVKIIANFGVGYNNIDIDYAAECGIVVTNTPDPVIEPTAEQAFALMLGVARRISECDRKLRIPNGLQWGVMENLGLSLYNKTLGIIGMGRIGQALARRAVASGMKIVYHNRKRLAKETENKYNARYMELDNLIECADFISIHIPLTDETKHLINRERLHMMKSTAILINTARGAVVDEKALCEVLQDKRIYGAGLDVFENEPEINPGLLRLDNVALSPHNGTATIEGRLDMCRFASQNIIRFFAGSKDITRVN